jgi:hypothetical protein
VAGTLGAAGVVFFERLRSLAAQLLDTCTDCRKVVGGARSGHVSSFAGLR